MKSFFEEVYEIVAKIPRGKVATYGQLAMLLGNPRGARTVGWAMKTITEEMGLPWYRVVNKKGLCYFDGQREILESEGISFLDNGCVDMKENLWQNQKDII